MALETKIKEDSSADAPDPGPLSPLRLTPRQSAFQLLPNPPVEGAAGYPQLRHWAAKERGRAQGAPQVVPPSQLSALACWLLSKEQY